MKNYYSKTTSQAVFNVEQAISKSLPTTPNPLFLVALSGGSDSLALAITASHAAKKKNAHFRVGAIIVNHKIQKETDEVSEKTRETALNLGLFPVIIKEVTVIDNGEGMEAAAREARYNAIRECVKETGAAGVLMGHTLNDQAEQVFLGLLRGSGTRSLSGIAPYRDNILRPFLSFTRETTQKICEEHGLDYWVDPQNSSTDYTRVKIRKNIIPLLEENFGEAILRNLYKTSIISREDADTLDYVTNDYMETVMSTDEDTTRLDTKKLRELPKGLQKRLIRKTLTTVFESYGSFANVNEVYKLLNPRVDNNKIVHVEKGRVQKTRDYLIFF